MLDDNTMKPNDVRDASVEPIPRWMGKDGFAFHDEYIVLIVLDLKVEKWRIQLPPYLIEKDDPLEMWSEVQAHKRHLRYAHLRKK